MFSNNFLVNKERDRAVFETVNKILTESFFHLKEAPDDETTEPSFMDYAKAKSMFVDDYDMARKVRNAQDEMTRQYNTHLPTLKARFDEALNDPPHTINGEFSFPEFDEDVATSHVVRKHMEEHGKEPDAKHIKEQVSNLKKRHASDRKSAFSNHERSKQRHERKFDGWLNDFINHPSNSGHPLVRSVKQAQEVERAASLASEVLPRFSAQNIARAAGDYVHGAATGRYTEYSSYARRKGGAHFDYRQKQRQRPTFDIGTAAPPEQSEHAPR